MKICKLGLTKEEIEVLLESGDIELCSGCNLLKMNDGIIHCLAIDENDEN